MNPEAATGIVLAGGRARRFGSDKLREDLDGSPLLHHAIERIGDVCASVVVVVAPGALPPPMPDGITVRVVRDEIGGEGPLRGAAAGLASAATEWAVLAGGDMPDLQPAVLTALLRFASDRGASAAALGDGGRFRPLPCVVRTAPAAETAERLLRHGERSLRSFLSSLSVAVLEEASWRRLDPEGRTLRDVDQPSDLDDRG